MNTASVLSNPYKDSPVSRAIVAAANSGAPRAAALKAVRWVLRSGSMYVGPCDPKTLECPLVTDRATALVFDGRDNPDLKAAFHSASFGAPFTPELL